MSDYPPPPQGPGFGPQQGPPPGGPGAPGAARPPHQPGQQGPYGAPHQGGGRGGPPPQGPPPQGPPPAPGAGAGAGAGNKKLLIILGSAGAAALVLILTLVLVLGGGSTYYSELVNCSDVENDLGLEGREARSVPALYVDRDVNANVDTFVECEGEDETGEIELSVLLLTPSYAEQDGAMEGRADLVHFEEQEDGNNYVEHEVSVGDHARALDDESMGSSEDSLAFVTYASGNLVLACAAEGAGTPEERIDRAIAACGSYEDAMNAEAPTI